MGYYIETRVSPHGQRRVLGGQAADGKPLTTYANRADAERAVAAERARMFREPAPVNFAGNVMPVEVNICQLADLLLVGRDGYMQLARLGIDS